MQAKAGDQNEFENAPKLLRGKETDISVEAVESKFLSFKLAINKIRVKFKEYVKANV